jgi:hypothetical protein
MSCSSFGKSPAVIRHTRRKPKEPNAMVWYFNMQGREVVSINAGWRIWEIPTSVRLLMNAVDFNGCPVEITTAVDGKVGTA